MRRFSSFIVSWWRGRQRAIDMATLWPSCKHAARLKYDDPEIALAAARAAFLTHALADEAWRALGDAELFERIDKLE